MKVWIVMREIQFDGDSIEDIFDSEEKARAYAEKMQKKDDYPYYNVEEWEVK